MMSSHQSDLNLPSYEPLPPKKSHINWGKLGAIAALAICVLACGGVILAQRAVSEFDKQTHDVQETVKGFMFYMLNKRTDQAYALFSARAQRQTPQSRLDDMLTASNFVLFDGFRGLQMNNINIGPNGFGA